MTRDADTPMRTGLTTGTCAAAAVKAAAMVLAGQSPPSAVEVMLPGGEVASVPVTWATRVSETVAKAGVVKDAGDDPDITNGSTIEVEVELGESGIRFAAGRGVGTVTKPGLQLEVGEPAINPVPREMIAQAIAEVLGDEAGALVTVSVPGGEALAAKTFGPRLGIEGGLSIIGTSGRVEPKSSEAWMRSLLPQIDVVRSAGHTTVWLVPGGIGERYAVEALGAPEDAVVHCSNFVGALLDACGTGGIDRVVLVGHAGKLVKLAAGIFDTHSRAGDARLETVGAIAAAEGASGPLVARLLELPTVQAAIAELEAAQLSGVWNAVAERAARRAAQRCDVDVDVVLLGYGAELLGGSREFAAGVRAGASAASVESAAPPERAASVESAASALGAASTPPAALAVVGVGPGVEEMVTPAAWREIRAAEVVAGGRRLLEAYAPERAERIEIGADVPGALAQVRSAVTAGRSTVVIASGDPALFGILAAVRRELGDLALRVVPGISSLQLALARLGESWEGLAVASAHGRDPGEAVRACETSERCLVLVDSKTTAQGFAAMLSGVGRFDVTVLERLGYPDERVTSGSADEIARGEFGALAVVFVRRSATRGT